MNTLPDLDSPDFRQRVMNLAMIPERIIGHLRVRSLALRLVAVLGALAIVFIGRGSHDLAFYTALATAYLIAVAVLGATSLALRMKRPLARFVVLDAVLVASVLYAHLLGAGADDNHGLTTAGLVVPFIFLSHVAMHLNARLILTFSATVLLAWVGMLGLMALRHDLSKPGSFLGTLFSLDLGLALSFGFAALSTCLLALDYDRTNQEARKLDRWRHNLARFFSPLVVADLQEAGNVLDLQRRSAGVMFVDLRDFTSYAETASAAELARVLAEYRRLVAGTVFAFGGTVDKFIGDGVMVVFGQPTAAADDAERALSCALELSARLTNWRPFPGVDGPVFQSGIGLHYGFVIGGVLESGYHDEFTVIGDAVNVAQRLEVLTKKLDASLVVSTALLTHAPRAARGEEWVWMDAVSLSGRRLPIDLVYLPRGTRRATAKHFSRSIGRSQAVRPFAG
jgi:adenylate cyclase